LAPTTVTFSLRPTTDRTPAFRITESSDWCALLASRANVLVSGAAPAAEAFLREAALHLRAPIQHIACEGGVAISASARTVILHDVEILTGIEQQKLLDWIDREPMDRRAQIIAHTAAPLFAHVQAQLFDEALYYRLNSIHFEVFQV
jgi:hypothetical protein